MVVAPDLVHSIDDVDLPQKLLPKKRREKKKGKKEGIEEVKQCTRRHSRSRKIEDGRHTGYGRVRRVNRVTSVANS